MQKEEEQNSKVVQLEKKEDGSVARKGSDDDSNTDLENAVAMCAAMGFDEKRAREVLPTVGNDVKRAIDLLSSDPNSDEGAGEGKSNKSSSKQRFKVTIPAGLKAGESVAVPLSSETARSENTSGV